MRITATVKDVTDAFFDRMATMADAEKLAYLMAKAQPHSGLERCVSVKIGSGQFRDAVEFNALTRAAGGQVRRAAAASWLPAVCFRSGARMTTWRDARHFLAIALTIDAAVALAFWAVH